MTCTPADHPSRVVACALGIPVIELLCNDRTNDSPRLVAPARGRTVRARASIGSDDAFVLLTSGTTSRPKLVPLTHAAACNSAYNAGASLELRENDRLLNMLPLFHAHGLFSGVLAALASGSSVVCTSGFDADRFFPWLAEFQPTWYTAVPTIHRAVLAAASGRREQGRCRYSLRLIRSASSPLPAAVLERLERTFRVPVIETYGMTEAASQIAANPLSAPKLNSVGKSAGADIAVVDSNGRRLPPGECGEVALRGPTITRGYPNDRRATAAAFRHGWFRTGDLGYLDMEGYLFILGRLVDVINRGGQKIAPAEIEQVLLSHKAVAEAAAFAVPHNRLGEDIAAAVVLRPGARTHASSLRKFARKHLAGFKTPNQIRIVPEIPKSAGGKLNRSGLAAAFSMTGRRTEAGTLPRSALEADLIKLWSELLELDTIGVNQNVFALGAESLTVTQMLSRLRLRFGVDLSLEDVLNAPTVAELATRIGLSASSRAAVPANVPAISSRAPGIPLSFQQQRIGILSRLDPVGSIYHVLEVARLKGPISADALEKSFRVVCSRHEVLRSTFPEGGEQIVGKVAPHLHRVDRGPVAAGRRAEVIRQSALEALRQPFDLEHEPPVRARLLFLDEDDHALILILHHIATDAWSQRVLWMEIESLYAMALNERHTVLPPPRLQYRDFARWQRHWLTTQAADAQRHYWQTQLDQFTPLPLPTDRPRPEQPTGRGARYALSFSPTLTRRLSSFSRQHGVTLFMTLLAAFQSVLHRYTGHHDIAVASVVANRNRLEFESLIGMFANTVILRTDLSGAPTVKEVLRRVKKATTEAYRNCDLPIEEVVRIVKPANNADRQAAFRSMFILQKSSRGPPSLGKSSISFMELDPGTARGDLLLELVDDNGQLRGWLEYSSDLFDVTTVVRLAGQLRTLLGTMVAHPERPISQLDPLPRPQRRLLLKSWSLGREEPLLLADFASGFSAQANKTPEAVAVSTGRARLSYRQLEQRSQAIAGRLAEEGVGPETIVVLLAERDVDFLAAMIGVQWVGAAFLPLSPTDPATRQAHIIGLSGAPVVLTDAGCAASVLPAFIDLPANTRPKLLNLAMLAHQEPRAVGPPLPPKPSRLAYVIYTSGSTGTPKGAMIEQRGLLNHLLCKVTDLRLSSRDVVAQTAPQSFDISVWQFLAPLLAGARVHIFADREVRDLALLVDVLETEGVTVLQVVPAMLRGILDLTRNIHARRKLTGLRMLLVTGEAIAPELLSEWFQQFCSIPVINAYGPAECADDVATHRMTSAPDSRAPVPIGRPIVNTRLYVLGGRRELVPPGAVGELYVGGLGVGRGYLNDARRTRERFLVDPFSDRRRGRMYRTGDLARWRSDGTLEFLGRIDDQIKLRGYRIEPGEIERCLVEHPGVESATVLLREAGRGESQLVAYWKAAPGPVPKIRALRDFLRNMLPSYMVPVGYVRLDRIPLTPHGKVDRKTLQASLGTIGVDEDEAEAPPRGATERTVAGIWVEVLGIENIGPFANFFDLGGHSLLAGKVLTRLVRECGVALPLAEFFATPTVEGIARAVDRIGRTDPGEPVLEITRGGANDARPASIAQEGVLRNERALPGLPQFNLPFAYRLQGKLDVTALERSISELMLRHEALRTAFEFVDGRAWARAITAAALPSPLLVEDLAAGIPATTTGSEMLLLEKARLRAEQAAWTAFDIGRSPLFRIQLLRLDVEDHVLVLVLHHAIVDGWSIGTLFEDLSTLYSSFACGTSVPLPEPAPQFSDFARWQRAWLDTPAASRQLSYWRQQLRDYQPLFSRPGIGAGGLMTSPVDYDTIHLPNDLVNALTMLSRRAGVTLFTTLLTGFKILLMTRCGRTDICVATAMANRSEVRTERTVGLFENTTVIRSQINAQTRLRDALDIVSTGVMEAYQRQQLPFGVLAPRLEEEIGFDLPSAIQACLIMRNSDHRPFELPEVTVQPFGDRTRHGMAVFPIDRAWITISLKPDQSGIVGSCCYKYELFGHGAPNLWSADYRMILEMAVADPEAMLEHFVIATSRRHGALPLDVPDSGAIFGTAVTHTRYS